MRDTAGVPELKNVYLDSIRRSILGEMKMIVEVIWRGMKAEKVFSVRLGNLPDVAVLEEVHRLGRLLVVSDVHHHAV